MSISLILITNRPKFESHAATVGEYLNWYRTSKADDRKIGTLLFGEYLISTCWRKMERRIGHWAAVGLIHNLWKLKDQDVSEAFLKSTPLHVTSSDFKLSTYVLFMAESRFLKGLLSYYDYTIPPDATLPDFQTNDSTKTKIVLPYLQELSSNGSNDLYNEKTVVEFHHLLVATLICYATGIRKLRLACEKEKQKLDMKDKHKKDESKRLKATLKGRGSKVARHDSEGSEFQVTEADSDILTTPAAVEEKREEKQMGEKRDQELPENCTFTSELNTTPSSPDEITVEDCVGGVLTASHLLNAIVVSGAFQHHIGFLVRLRLLKILSDKDQEQYKSFADLKEIPWQQFRKTGVLGVGDGSGDPVSGGMEDNNEMDQDPWDDDMTPEQDVMAVQGWIKIFVQHLHAKSVLETYARHVGNKFPIDIKTYGLRFPKNPLLMPTWETVEDIIKVSLPEKSEDDRAKIITIFKGHFISRREGGNNIFNLIGDIIDGKANTRHYHVHCEVALAGLVAAASGPSKKMECYADGEIIEVLQVGLVPSMHCISVRPFLRL